MFGDEEAEKRIINVFLSPCLLYKLLPGFCSQPAGVWTPLLTPHRLTAQFFQPFSYSFNWSHKVQVIFLCSGEVKIFCSLYNKTICCDSMQPTSIPVYSWRNTGHQVPCRYGFLCLHSQTNHSLKGKKKEKKNQFSGGWGSAWLVFFCWWRAYAVIHFLDPAHTLPTTSQWGRWV